VEHKKVFISYSWDSKEHQEWVIYLANRLRKKGLIAEVDVFETQVKSTSLYRMMVEKVRNSDYIIIVLTENYAQKADSFTGGVGFESHLTLPLLMENPNKLVPIMKHNGDYRTVFPFHLKGQYAIDFSQDQDFEEKLEELIYRLYETPLHYMEPIGDIPKLEPKMPSLRTEVEPKITFTTPNLRKVTEKDKDDFLNTSFNTILDTLEMIFKKIQQSNPNFDFTKDMIHNQKTIFSLYIEGSLVEAVRIMITTGWGSKSISVLYGNRSSMMDDGSSNELYVCEVSDDKALYLKSLLNSFSNTSTLSAEDTAINIWENNLLNRLK
jgi:hypothetical protein